MYKETGCDFSFNVNFENRYKLISPYALLSAQIIIMFIYDTHT